jgi:hypothetical protein
VNEEHLELSSFPKEKQAYVDTVGPIYTKAWKAMTIKNSQSRKTQKCQGVSPLYIKGEGLRD